MRAMDYFPRESYKERDELPECEVEGCGKEICDPEGDKAGRNRCAEHYETEDEIVESNRDPKGLCCDEYN